MKKWTKYVTAKKLMERWNIDADELAEAIIYNGLMMFVRTLDDVQEASDLSIPKYYGSVVDLLKNEYRGKGKISLHGSGTSIHATALFLVAEVKKFEKKHRLGEYSDTPSTESSASPQASLLDLGPDEKRELGRLRMEKGKWDTSIKAAIAALSFCSQQRQQITKEQLQGYLIKQKLEIPETTFRMIWRELPEKYRQKSGRPPKK